MLRASSSVSFDTVSRVPAKVSKTAVTGNPVRPGLHSGRSAQLGIRITVLLVLGGSLGARAY